MEKLLSPKKFSELTGICKDTLASWRRAKTGPAFIKADGKNGRVFYTQESLNNWLISNEIKTKQMP
jgi:hypothetical protein